MSEEIELLIKLLPWVLSANTLYVMFLAGNRRKYAWLLGLVGQLLWLVWIILVQAWGLLPMNIGLWIIYGRNHLKWNAHHTKPIKEGETNER